jgi:hypothetical protein
MEEQLRTASSFPLETMQARRELSATFKVLWKTKIKNINKNSNKKQPRILYSANLPFNKQGVNKNFLRERKMEGNSDLYKEEH